jgi:hypothetical protein
MTAKKWDRQRRYGSQPIFSTAKMQSLAGFSLKDEALEVPEMIEDQPLVVERAWAARLRVTVVAEEASTGRPRRIVLHPTPNPL